MQIRLTEKHPLYIVQEASGKSYYVTQGKGTITVNPTFAAYLPIVSGAVDLKMATGPVYDLMAALREDPYFTDYFGQVYVDETDGIVLIPRIGTTRVIMGRESNWSEKLRKWRIFAESVLPKRGMNAFSYVNLDYGTQIIARSRYAPEGETFDEEGEVVAAPTPAPAPAPSPKPAPAVSAAPAPKKPAATEKPREKAKEAPKYKPKDKPASKPGDKAKTDKKEPKKDPKKDTKKPAPQQAPTPKKPNKPTEKGKPNKPQKK